MANNYPYQQGQGQPHMPVSMPVLHNPFKPDRPALPFRAAGEKDIAKQQSSYQSLTNKSLPESQESRTVKPSQANQVLVHGKIKPDKPAEKKISAVRESGGQVRDDPTLLEWDPSHFRLFVGDLAEEVTDETLFKVFSKYPTLVKARVVRDRKTTRSTGFGFSWKEMNGKYIGSHPIKLRKATTELKAKVITQKTPDAKKRFSPYEVA